MLAESSMQRIVFTPRSFSSRTPLPRCPTRRSIEQPAALEHVVQRAGGGGGERDRFAAQVCRTPCSDHELDEAEVDLGCSGAVDDEAVAVQRLYQPRLGRAGRGDSQRSIEPD